MATDTSKPNTAKPTKGATIVDWPRPMVVTPGQGAPRRMDRKPMANRDKLIRLLKRRSGVTIKQLEDSFGWQPHSARAALSMLRKSGLNITREGELGASVYRLHAQKAST